MSSLSLAIVDTEKSAIDPLAAIHAEKFELQSQIAELNSERERLTALAAQAGEQEAALREIDRTEAAMFSGWAASGAKGNAPALLTAERQAASTDLALARAKAAGAAIAIQEVEARQAEAGAALAEIDRKIDAAIIDALESGYQAARERFGRALAGARAMAADVFGTRAVILGQAENLRNLGQTEEANLIYRRVEGLDRAGIDLDATPLVAEINRALECAKARAVALRKGN
jgi:hypothetical protein